MKGLPVRRLIDARCGIIDASAKVLHVAEDMAFAVLRHGLAEIGADTKKGCCGLLDRIALNRDAADDYKASALQQNVVANQSEVLSESRQFKVVPINCYMIDSLLYDGLYGNIDLDNLCVGKSVGEITRLS